jgi:hypothetical protein
VPGVTADVTWSGCETPGEPALHKTDLSCVGRGTRSSRSPFGPTRAPTCPRRSYARPVTGSPARRTRIYVRDLAARYNCDLADTYPAEKLIKLACIYELIGLPDCAAEMLNRFEPRLGAFGDLEALRDR